MRRLVRTPVLGMDASGGIRKQDRPPTRRRFLALSVGLFVSLPLHRAEWLVGDGRHACKIAVSLQNRQVRPTLYAVYGVATARDLEIREIAFGISSSSSGHAGAVV